MVITRVIWAYIIALSAVLSLSAQETEGSPEVEYEISGPSAKLLTGKVVGIKAGEKCPSHVIIQETYKGYPVTQICYNAFKDCTELCSIDLPKHLKKIGWDAFQNTSLKSLVLPDSVIEIESGAFNNSPIENVKWSKNLEIVYGFENTKLSILHLPSKVKSIGSFKNTPISEVVLPNSIEDFSYNFIECQSLKTITSYDTGNPGKSTSIDLYNLDGLEHVDLRHFTADYINLGYCTNLKSAVLPKSLNDMRFVGCKSLESLDLSGNTNMTKIREGCFYNCSSLEEISLPPNIKLIDIHAFQSCSSLKSICMPNSVDSLGYRAFKECRSLEDVKLSDNLKNLPAHAFLNCINLKQITVPASVKNIDGPFSGCKDLVITVEDSDEPLVGTFSNMLIDRESIYFDGSESYQYDVYAEYPIKKIITYRELKYPWYNRADSEFAVRELEYAKPGIPCNKFYGDTILEKITVYGDIPMSAFQLTPNLKEVVIKGGNVGPLAFNYSGVKKIKFDSDSQVPTDSIGFGAFNFCTALQEIEFPETVRHIGFCAMEECSALSKVTLPGALDSIPHFLFSGCRSLQSVEIPSSVSQIPNTAFRHCKSLKELRILGDDNTPAIHFGMDALRYSNIEKLYLDRPWDNAVSPFFGTESLVELELGKHITSLPNFAFGNCSSLVKIHCANPEPPTLGRGAFRGVSRSACTVTVAGSDNGYRNAETWKEFFGVSG